jgi:hypothetical protein
MSQSRVSFAGGPLDGASLEGLNDTDTMPPKIIIEYPSVRCPENVELLGGLHLPTGGAIHHVYEFNEDSDNPAYECIGQPEAV